MGLFLQIIGLLILLISLIFSIFAIVNGFSSTVSVVLVVFGGLLVRIGRKIYNNNHKL